MKQRKARFVRVLLIFTIPLFLELGGLARVDAAGTGVADALTPSGDWEQLSAGQSGWYAFEYAGDGSQIQVRLEIVPAGSVQFVVWTPEAIRRWGLGEAVEPIGRGSDDPFTEGVLAWSGNFTTAGTYFVVVEQTAGQPGTSYYRLEIEGDGVSFPASRTTGKEESATTTISAHSSANSQPKSLLASRLTGTLVFQTTYGGPLYTINADGSGLQRITNGIDPIWSPDGKQIAFARWEDPRGVWVANSDGSDAHRVFDWTETRYPSWSPDGQEIVFSRQKGGGGGGFRGGPPGGPPGMGGSVTSFAGRPPGGPPGGSSSSGATLGIVNASDGTFREPRPVSETNLTPDWSPPSAGEPQIVLAGNNGLMVQSVDGLESWQLTSNPYDTTPAWSPDATKVAFARRQHDHWEVYVIDVTTGQQTRLTETPDLNGVATSSVSPAWSPDGKAIAFLTNRTGEWQIWVMEADGGNEGPLLGSELDSLVLEYAFAGERALDWSW